MEAPPTTRNLLLVKILRRLSALSLMAASSVLVSMWCHLPSTQLQRLQTLRSRRAGMVSAVNGNAVSLDAYNPLAVERAPSALAFLASNGEVPATNDRGVLGGSASALHLPGVPRIELQGTNGPVELLELYRDNAAASILNEALNKSSLVRSSEDGAHGKKKREALASEKRLWRFRLSALRLPMKEQYRGFSPHQRLVHTL